MGTVVVSYPDRRRLLQVTRPDGADPFWSLELPKKMRAFLIWLSRRSHTRCLAVSRLACFLVCIVRFSMGS